MAVCRREAVLDQERHLVGQAYLDLVGQVGGLAESDKVFEREAEGDRLGHLDRDALRGLVGVGVASQGDGSVTDVAGARKLDTVL